MAIVLALKTRILAKNEIFIPKCTEGGGLWSIGLQNIPKKHFFDTIPNFVITLVE